MGDGMQLHLEAHSLWGAIEFDMVSRKDHQILLVMLGVVCEEF